MICLDQTARFDPYLTQVDLWRPVFKNIESRSLTTFEVETYVCWIHFDQSTQFDLNSAIWPKFGLWWPLIVHDINRLEIGRQIRSFQVYHLSWPIRWRFRAIWRTLKMSTFLKIILDCSRPENEIILFLSKCRQFRLSKCRHFSFFQNGVITWQKNVIYCVFRLFLGFRPRKWPPATKSLVLKWSQEHGEHIGS